MAEEQILVSIKLESADNEAKIDALTRSITGLKEETADLAKQNQELAKQGKTNSDEFVNNARQIEVNNQKVQENTASRKGLISTLVAEDGSVKSLRVQNAELIKQRDLISTKTSEGRDKIALLNAQMDKNNTAIKENSSSLEKQKMGVGDYTAALDKLVPGLGSTVQGFQGMAKAAMAFIATPIGAVIGALGLALGALMAYFKGSEEGQNRWNKIVIVGSTILEKMMDVLEDLGEFIFDTGRSLVEAFSKPKEIMENLVEFLKDQVINRFKSFGVILEGIKNMDFKQVANGVLQFETGVVDVIGKVGKLKDAAVDLTEKAIEYGKKQAEAFSGAIKEGSDLADMEARFDRESRERTIAKAQRDLDVSLLRRKADEAEGEEKLKYLNQALDLEEQNVKAMVATATLARDIAKEKSELNGKDKQLKDDLAKAEADLLSAQRGAFDETRKMNKERIATEKAIAGEIVKRIDADQELQHQEEERVAMANERADEELTKAFERITKKDEEQAKSQEQTIDNLFEGLEIEQEVSDQSVYIAVKAEQTKREEAKKTFDIITAIIMATGDVVADLFGKTTAVAQMELANQLDAMAIHYGEEKALREKANDEAIAELQEQSKQEVELAMQRADAQVDIVIDRQNIERAALKKKFDDGLIDEEEYNKEVEKLKKKHDKEINDATKIASETVKEVREESVKAEKELLEQQKATAVEIERQRKQEEDDIKRKAFESNKKNKIADSIIDAIQSGLAAFRALAGIPIVGPVLGAVAAAAAVAFGYKQVDLLRNQQYVPGVFARGGRADKRGTFVGESDENGGRGVDYIRSDGRHRIRVGGGENFYVLKRTASDEINALSSLNVRHGGRSFFTGRAPIPSSLALGGSVTSQAGLSASDVENIMRTTLDNVKLVVTVEDINAGQNRVAQVEDAANLL